MPAKAQQFVPKGMKRDYSPSKADPQFAFENHNIRITPMEGSTLLSVTNEKGTAPAKFSTDPYNRITIMSSYNPTSDSTTINARAERITPDVSVTIDIDYIDPDGYSNSDQIYLKNGSGVWEAGGKCTFVKATVTDSTVRSEDSIFWINLKDKINYPIFPGTYLGHCIINNFIVLFFHEGSSDYIIRLENINGTFKYKLLYEGNLNLDYKAPIEAIGVYENNDIQKVYWVDGRNQPRVINILEEYDFMANKSIFDFIPDMPSGVSLEVVQEQGGPGIFSPGTIQYAVSFYKKHGQESGLSDVSSPYYIGFKDRGASPEETVGTSFRITIGLHQTEMFDYVRVYSIHRTSKDATPTVKVVGDVLVKNLSKVTLLDTGRVGYNVDPTLVLYLGGTMISANTIEQKDNTLFLGGYTITEEALTKELKDYIWDNSSISFEYVDKPVVPESNGGTYPYKGLLNLNSEQITTFKSREWYRFGLQFQYKSGKWSDVVWIGDRRNTLVPKHTKTDGKQVVQLTQGKASLSREAVTKLRSSFVNVRGVIVYPEFNTQEVICQGVLNPTVYSVRDRGGNSPFAQASWFFRENLSYPNNSIAGYGVEMRHNHALKYKNKDSDTIKGLATMGAEIQGMWEGSSRPNPYLKNGATEEEKNKFIQDYSGTFYVDQSILTLNSPDIDFDDKITSLKGANLKMRIVGTIPITSMTRYATLITDTLGQNGRSSSINLKGYSKSEIGTESGILEPIGAIWEDSVAGITNAPSSQFLIYPWHRNGSLNNFPTPVDGETRAALWDRKIFSNLRVANYTWYFPEIPLWDADGSVVKDDETGYVLRKDNDSNGITSTQIFDSEEITLLRIPSPENSNLPDLSYYGNIDTIFTDFGDPTATDSPMDNSYPITVYGTNSQMPQAILPYYLKDIMPSIANRYLYGSDPIPMSYKSTKHAVFALNYTNSKQQRILPTISVGGDDPEVGALGEIPFWASASIGSSTSWVKPTIFDKDPAYIQAYSYLYLAELYRDTSEETRFGGNTDKTLESNKWIVAGDSVPLGSSAVDITYGIGDTYYQRYDCLKTYPFSTQSKNNIVEILSFMCETKVNIEGRYDQNRGQLNNTTMSPLNFNLLNPAYTQLNNFFISNFIDAEDFSIQDFSNSITWTKTKTFGEEIDSWTNLNLASTLDLDGDKGKIEALRRFNNELYCFQPLGISRILYNSRAQMATLGEGAAAMPVELANTGKVEGKVYITNGIGSTNKWSIVTTPSGMYFIDDLTNSIQLLGADGISDLSDKLAFREWVNRVSSVEKWTPEEDSEGFKNIVTYYDPTNSDVYFITNSPDTTVAYSELVGQFSSFYDYDKVPLMFSMGGKFFSLKNNKLWEQNAGEYNLFFGIRKPYSVEVICNVDEPIDKIFNTIEWRATIKDGQGNDSTSTFDTVRVTTDGEYQDTGEVPIINKTNNPSGGMITLSSTSLRRMFRMWRIPIPRDQRNKRDRMRGPWAKIKLSKRTPLNERMELHDIIVHFFE